jgi:hypothetical protein
MKFYFYLFSACLKTTASPSFCVAFLLLMLVILAAGRLFNDEKGLRIKVGVYPAMDLYSDDCEIIPYTDENQMRLDVAAFKLECAYAFPMDGGKITAYRSPWTVSGGVVDLLVAAAYVESMAGELGGEVLRPFLDTPMDIAAEVQRLTGNYLADGVLMDTVYVEIGEGVKPQTAAAPYRRLFKGLTGLLGLLLALLCGMGFTETEASIKNRLRAAGRNAGLYNLTGMAVVFFITGLFLTGMLLIGNFLYPGVVLQIQSEIITGWAFAFASAGLAVLAGGVLKSNGIGWIVFIFIASALFSGALFDIGEIWSAASFARFLFLNYYFTEGQTGWLFFMGMVMALFVYLESIRRV